MQQSHLLPNSSGSPLPERFLSQLAGFTDLFTRPTWSNVLVLLAGAILAPGRRTVTTALRILGRECDPDFCTFHRILNRAAWSSRAVARHLLILLVRAFVPSGGQVGRVNRSVNPAEFGIRKRSGSGDPDELGRR